MPGLVIMDAAMARSASGPTTKSPIDSTCSWGDVPMLKSSQFSMLFQAYSPTHSPDMVQADG